MSWFNTEGYRPHHVIYTQTKYIRNLSALPFASSDAKLLEDEMQRIDKVMTENGFKRENIPDGNCPQALSLAEKGFVGIDFCENESVRALYLNEPCSLAISIGDSDLITIRSLLSGLAVAESKNVAAGAEELLDGEFEFAYSDAFGYLTSLPSSSGSGTELSVLLYLPALTSVSAERVKETCASSGARFTRAFAYESNADHLYRLSYVPKRFEDENREVIHFTSLVERIIELEKGLERIVFTGQDKAIIDKAMRAMGILLFATVICEEEMLSLLSDVRLALTLGLEYESLKITSVKLGEILAECLNASIIASSAIPCVDMDECNALRAERIKEILSDE